MDNKRTAVKIFHDF